MTTQSLNTGATSPDSTAAPAGHDAAMAAKFDSQQQQSAPNTGTADRPAWLDPKFQSGEDLAKAYNELQKKIGSQNTTQQQQTTQTTQTPQSSDAARQTVESAGLDFDALSDEFASSGALSEATYEALAKSNIPRSVVDQYIAGQQAVANELRSTILTAVGGEEAYGDMVGWAKTNMSGPEIAAYNSVMNSGDVNAMRLAVDGLRSRYTADNGSAPKLISGGSSQNASSGEVFRSLHEMKTAMADPRYAADPAYRNDVIAKLGRSNIM